MAEDGQRRFLRPIGRRYQAVVEVGVVARLSSVVACRSDRRGPVSCVRAARFHRARFARRMRPQPRVGAACSATFRSGAYRVECRRRDRGTRRDPHRISRIGRSDAHHDRAVRPTLVAARAFGDVRRGARCHRARSRRRFFARAQPGPRAPARTHATTVARSSTGTPTKSAARYRTTATSRATTGGDRTCARARAAATTG